jgi:trehalose 2-sulfotransferase
VTRRRPGAARLIGAPRPASYVRETYLICTTPRSGSWLLSEGLASTSVAGNPREWFHAAQEQEERAHWRIEHSADLTFATYLEHARTRATSRNGICGIKLHYYQFAELQQKLAELPRLRQLTGPGRISAVFPNVRHLWLTRRDKARQAISYYLAVTTDTWWLIDRAEAKATANTSHEPEFDPHEIRRLESLLLDGDARWEAYFKAAIEPLVVYYEDLLADYRCQVVRVLQWLGLRDAERIHLLSPRLQRQSTNRNDR